MQVKIWGARGSTPVEGPQFTRYSGATACIEVRTDDGDVILLDAGTGLTAYAREAAPSKQPVVLLSHLHLDHTQGLPFYGPLYAQGLTIYGPEEEPGALESTLGRLFDGIIFPVKWENLQNVRPVAVASGASFNIGSAHVEAIRTSHTSLNLAWKITADGRTLVYTGDHEIPLHPGDAAADGIHSRLLDFMTGADIAIVDSHFDRQDHESHAGWGHSDFFQWGPSLRDRNIRQIVFTHFSPQYTDDRIDKLLVESQAKTPELNIIAAKSCMELNFDGISMESSGGACAVCDFFAAISSLSDTHAILDAILTESRRLTGADAGSVYLEDNGELAFAAAQNDTLFPASAANKYAYMNARLPITRASIAGFVADTVSVLNIPDVYFLPPGSEFGFNDSFDRATGYRTRSVLAVPLVNAQGRMVGVLQLINARIGATTVPFGPEAQRLISRLAGMATIPLEKSFLIVGMILRMLHTSALRDPSETAMHVRRVGSVSAELYHRWAEARGMDPEEIRAVKGRLRLAAMLHDIGKVGIPDEVLKKPGRLDEHERAIMQTHAALGAGLFDGEYNEIDVMAREIALHHHAKWNGTGYTGSSEIKSPAGEEIPLSARIVAIADVFDALVSRRCYKEAWNDADAIAILRKDAGSHFDPELVEHFVAIQDIVRTIYERYS